MREPVAGLLDKGFARKLAKLLDPGKRVPLPKSPAPSSDTIYLTVVDRDCTTHTSDCAATADRHRRPDIPQLGRLPPVPAPAKPLRASAHVAELSLASHPNTYPGVHISLLQRSCTPSFG